MASLSRREQRDAHFRAAFRHGVPRTSPARLDKRTRIERIRRGMAAARARWDEAKRSFDLTRD